ncbi:phage tail protein [Desulfovibrio mangrovi]|uniref:phage tail protein n=1 Tax=Desulfovibrio mangrovi TaxID=2976983 RepID=UPI002247171E|nr:phage tail protein [Desulfovibrio mangrovi]UZP67659.1 phage tail protein [Desulfovibrio mangrovi]
MSKTSQTLVLIDRDRIDRQMRVVEQTLKHIKDGYKTVAMRAVNKTLDGMRTDVVRLIRSTYAVPARDLRDKLAIIKASKSYLRGSLTAKGPISVPLMRYGAYPRAPFISAPKGPKGKRHKGVTVKVRNDGGRKGVRHAFVLNSPSTGNAEVVRRVHADQRYPICLLYGPGHLAALRQDDNVHELQEQAMKRFGKAIEHEARYLIEKAGLR